MATRAATRTKAADDYLDLVRRFPLAPIRGDAHLKAAFAAVDELSVIDEDRLTPGQADYLAVLTDLVEQYEDAHVPPDRPFADGIDAVAYLLGEHGMSASDLGRLLGNRQLGSALLRRDRALSKAHIATLCERFKVSADLFIPHA